MAIKRTYKPAHVIVLISVIETPALFLERQCTTLYVQALEKPWHDEKNETKQNKSCIFQQEYDPTNV
jgi:hypothetical protein